MPRDTLTAPGMWLVWYSSASRTSSSTSAFLMASSAWSSGISRISARAASTRSCAVFIGSLLSVWMLVRVFGNHRLIDTACAFPDSLQDFVPGALHCGKILCGRFIYAHSFCDVDKVETGKYIFS